MLQVLAIAGYRSLQQLVLPLGQLTVISGANGSGKSNLYRALGLIAAAARGELVARLAREGGLPAVLWAGPQQLSRAMRAGEQPVQGGPRSKPVRLKLGFGSDLLSYAIQLGYPQNGKSAFSLDPQIKRECLWAGVSFHPRALLADWTPSETTTAAAGMGGLLGGEADPQNTAEVLAVRELILSWRFYDSLRTDAAAPARHPGIASRCLALSNDGHDLPAAVQTILEIGDARGLQSAVADAFPGCELSLDTSSSTFRLQLRQPGLLRPLDASELSDGTLRYLLLTTALLSPRLPPCWCSTNPKTACIPTCCLPWRGASPLRHTAPKCG